MKSINILAAFGSCLPAAVAPLLLAGAGSTPLLAQEVPKEIIAVQIRRQGFACAKPLSATREGDATKFDDAVWVLKCDDATYKVQLIPNMAAKVERLPDAGTQDAKGASP